DVLRDIRVRYALPGLAAGLQAAIPVALLGSMLGEFTGARWGLGSYLLAIMAQGDASKDWGIFIVTAAIAAGISWVSAAIWRHCGIEVTTVEPLPQKSGHSWHTAIGLLLSVCLWEIASRYVANPYFVKGPTAIVRYMMTQTAEAPGFFR